MGNSLKKKHLHGAWLASALLWGSVHSAWALDLSGLKANEVAVYVQNMDTGRTVLEHRADAAMNEAKPRSCDTRSPVLKRYRLSVRSPSIMPRPRPYQATYSRKSWPSYLRLFFFE